MRAYLGNLETVRKCHARSASFSILLRRRETHRALVSRGSGLVSTTLRIAIQSSRSRGHVLQYFYVVPSRTEKWPPGMLLNAQVDSIVPVRYREEVG